MAWGGLRRGAGGAAIWLGSSIWHVLPSAYQCLFYSLLFLHTLAHGPPTPGHSLQCLFARRNASSLTPTTLSLPSSQPEKTEAVRTKRKYEKKPKIPPLSATQHSGPSVFNPKDLNQYDFPSSDEEPFSQVTPFSFRFFCCDVVLIQL